MDRNLIFAKDPTYTHQSNNTKITYKYSKWEEYGYLDYVPYADYLQGLCNKGEIDEETRSKAVSIGRTADKDSEVVKQYVAKNNLTYKRIESLFCSEIPHLLKPVNEIISKQQESFDKKPNSRWHFKSPLKSADGIDFLVTTQIGDNCPIDFKDVVTLAASLGYNIEKID